jgi:hypothetical protein
VKSKFSQPSCHTVRDVIFLTIVMISMMRRNEGSFAIEGRGHLPIDSSTRQEQIFIGDHVELEVETATDEVLDASTDAAMLLWKAFDPYQPIMLEQQALDSLWNSNGNERKSGASRAADINSPAAIGNSVVVFIAKSRESLETTD